MWAAQEIAICFVTFGQDLSGWMAKWWKIVTNFKTTCMMPPPCGVHRVLQWGFSISWMFRPVYDERQNCKIERRKRNLKFFSPVSRGERETGNSFPQFREEKEKSKKIFSTFERRKRNGFSILKLWEEKEKVKTISPFSRGEREIRNPFLQFREEKEKS